MEKAFAPGYDPALAVATHAKERIVRAFEDAEEEHRLSHVRRDEQDFIDRIVSGREVGHYYMILGPKVRKRAKHINRVLDTNQS